MKNKIFETDRTEELIQIQQLLRDSGIDFDVRTKLSTMIHNFFNLIFYHVLTTGIERRNEVMCVYVEEKDFDHAQKIMQEIKAVKR